MYLSTRTSLALSCPLIDGLVLPVSKESPLSENYQAWPDEMNKYLACRKWTFASAHYHMGTHKVWSIGREVGDEWPFVTEKTVSHQKSAGDVKRFRNVIKRSEKQTDIHRHQWWMRPLKMTGLLRSGSITQFHPAIEAFNNLKLHLFQVPCKEWYEKFLQFWSYVKVSSWSRYCLLPQSRRRRRAESLTRNTAPTDRCMSPIL